MEDLTVNVGTHRQRQRRHHHIHPPSPPGSVCQSDGDGADEDRCSLFEWRRYTRLRKRRRGSTQGFSVAAAVPSPTTIVAAFSSPPPLMTATVLIKTAEDSPAAQRHGYRSDL
ncbi:hypothetical protein PIB30_118266 [Stylosanthes scabra]|uniref:Uncharacterized protein n=1 Tax=Stylosanthes scabra TaxID=79078 RepID=A0ABU6SKE1_9FABA|nr:hypothetical protein [Stylosanthes scabra]